MLLSEKLNSISANETVSTLSSMLKKAQVNISWYGERIVSIERYQGYVTINDIAVKYLRATPFDQSGNQPLQERLNCYNLWERIQLLYDISEMKLKMTCFFKHVIPLIEPKSYTQASPDHPMSTIRWNLISKKEHLFAFTPTQFIKIWPKVKPSNQSTFVLEGKRVEKWTASKDMVKEAIRHFQHPRKRRK